MIFLSLFNLVSKASTHEFNSFTQNQSYTNSVTPKILEQEVSARMDRVAEFKFIREVAKKYGVDIYLFGGTASAYAHYVRWDLLREEGDPRFQPERFDYFFDNIYRSNQDLDIVVDSDAETAGKIASELKQKFNHFVGNKDAWEVRLLREQIGDKLPLLNDPDFANQHTDSNSIGIIKVNANEDRSFYDLRDWDNTNSLYLKDVASANMTYLFSDKHASTSRFKEGKNPAILSAIRYLAKATQYELTLKGKDLEKIKEVIDSTKAEDLSSYSRNKLIEFTLKALLNSPDVEYAWNLLESTGARSLAINTSSSHNTYQGLSPLWLSKEPLRSYPLGKGKLLNGYTKIGKTAKELGIDIVAHETNGFQAFDSITKSSKGRPNVFISRDNAKGEQAAYGDGFYTKAGKEGARNTGITIRFKVHPEAVEGVDFIYNKSQQYLVFNNKNALVLIPEKISLNVVDYFKLLAGGEVTDNDKGLINRIKTRIQKSIEPTDAEIKETSKIILDNKDSSAFNFMLSEWLNILDSMQGRTKLDTIDYFNLLVAVQNTNIDEEIPKKIYTQIQEGPAATDAQIKSISQIVLNNTNTNELGFVYKGWLNLKNAYKHPEVLLALIEANTRQARGYKGASITSELLTLLINEEKWLNYKDNGQMIEALANALYRLESLKVFIKKIVSHEDFLNYPNYEKVIEILLQKNQDAEHIHRTLLTHVFNNEYWLNHSNTLEHFKQIANREYSGYQNHQQLIEMYLSKEIWSKKPGMVELLMELTSLGDSNNETIVKYILSSAYWQNHAKAGEILELYMQNQVSGHHVADALKHKAWSKHPNSFKYVKMAIEGVKYKSKYSEGTTFKANRSISKKVLSQKHWQSHPKYIDMVKLVIENMNKGYHPEQNRSSLVIYVFSQEAFINHPESTDILISFIQSLKGEKLKGLMSHTTDLAVVNYVIKNPTWASHKRYNEIVATLISIANYEALTELKPTLELNSHKNSKALNDLKKQLIGKKPKPDSCSSYLSGYSLD